MMYFKFSRTEVMNIFLISVTGLLQCVQPAHSQTDYPNRPIRLIVGFSAGGPTDSAARVVAETMGRVLGQPMIVENRPGANSQVAAMELIKSPPDGYTIFLASNGTLTIAPARYAQLTYDVSLDFAPIGSVAGYPHVLVVPAQSEATDLRSFIEMGKKRKQGLNAASVGHVNDLTLEWLQKDADIKITTVAYKVDSAVISDLIGNRIDLALLAPSIAIPLIEGNKIKSIGLSGGAVMNHLPGVIPLKQTGFVSVDVEIWNGLVAPAGTNPAILNKLNGALNQVLQSPELQTKLDASGLHVIIDTPTQFTEKIRTETLQWKSIAREANLPDL